MPTTHVVEPGDTVASIAAAHGFRDPDRIFGDPANAELRAARPSPDLLVPGDVVTIPDREPKEVAVKTDLVHTFALVFTAHRLRLRLVGPPGQSLVGVAYELEVDGETRRGSVGAGSMLVEDIEPSAVEGLLRLIPVEGAPIELTLNIGHLQPVSEDRGAQARLANLGHYHGELDGDLGSEATRTAIAAFVRARGLAVSDPVMTDELREQLVAAHGC